MGAVYCALVHHPVRNRAGESVTTSVTNLDVHDLARSARTYDLAGYFVISPIEAQHAILGRILEHWAADGVGTRRMPERTAALARCRGALSIEDACAAIEAAEGRAPRIAVTAARAPRGRELIPFAEAGAAMRRSEVPALILFGTGHGLVPRTLEAADVVLPPVRGGAEFNHLSVRAAAAIVLDRLFGEAGVNSGASRD